VIQNKCVISGSKKNSFLLFISHSNGKTCGEAIDIRQQDGGKLEQVVLEGMGNLIAQF